MVEKKSCSPLTATGPDASAEVKERYVQKQLGRTSAEMTSKFERRDRSECPLQAPGTALPSSNFISHTASGDKEAVLRDDLIAVRRQSTVARYVACATDLCCFCASPAACDAPKSSASILLATKPRMAAARPISSRTRGLVTLRGKTGPR